jgi:hypothetical protein
VIVIVTVRFIREANSVQKIHEGSSWLQIQRSLVRFPVLLDSLRSSGSGMGSSQPREYN